MFLFTKLSKIREALNLIHRAMLFEKIAPQVFRHANCRCLFQKAGKTSRRNFSYAFSCSINKTAVLDDTLEKLWFKQPLFRFKTGFSSFPLTRLVIQQLFFF